MVYARNNKIWCCLENLDLLFTILIFVFFCTDHYMYLFSKNYGMLLWHMFIVQKFHIFLFCLLFVSNKILDQEHMSSGAENSCQFYDGFLLVRASRRLCFL
jgi:hypothetical protein